MEPSLEPRYVSERIKWHNACMEQDVRQILNRLRDGETPTLLELRELSNTWRTADKMESTAATPAAWHPYIMDYCRLMGVEHDGIDRLFKRLTYGDVTDKLGLVRDRELSSLQLVAAYEKAHRLWLNRYETILGDEH